MPADAPEQPFTSPPEDSLDGGRRAFLRVLMSAPRGSPKGIKSTVRGRVAKSNVDIRKAPPIPLAPKAVKMGALLVSCACRR